MIYTFRYAYLFSIESRAASKWRSLLPRRSVSSTPPVLGPLWTRAAKNIYSGYLCSRHDIGYVLRLLTAAVSVSTRKLTQVADAASDCPPQSALSLTLPLSAAKVMFWLRVINNNRRH